LTHPDTYNLVGFNGCLHLWWIPLLTPELLTPELLTPELCVSSVTMNQFSLTTRLALNEFQASCYSHHRSQSALGETNWPLRASGCNLTLNPYLVIQMGHYHGHPLTGAMELRPDHWSATLKVSPKDPKELCTDTDQTYSINKVIFIMHITPMPTFITKSIPCFMLNPTHLIIKDVKMSFNPWANPAHRRFEPGWVEKNLTFSKVGWTQPGSLNPRVKRVRAELKVGWPT